VTSKISHASQIMKMPDHGQRADNVYD